MDETTNVSAEPEVPKLEDKPADHSEMGAPASVPPVDHLLTSHSDDLPVMPNGSEPEPEPEMIEDPTKVFAAPPPQTLNPASFGITNGEAEPAPAATDPNAIVVSKIDRLVPITQRGSRKWRRIIFSALLLALLAGGGYVFAIYLPNTPNNVYSAGLVNSGKAVDALIQYAKTQQQVVYNSYGVTGSLTAKSSIGSFDLNLNLAYDQRANAMGSIKADIMGNPLTANIRSVNVPSSTNPDFYFQLVGIKPLLDQFGESKLSAYDGQWIAIDHTLLDTAERQFEQQSGTSTSAQQMVMPTYTQTLDGMSKAQAVTKQYIFTTDSSKAVLTNQRYIGVDKLSGQATNHYKVGYSQAHLQAYIQALGQALDSSQLDAWSKQQNEGKSVSQLLDLTSLEHSIQQAKPDYTFDVWVSQKTRLVQQLSFSDPSDASSVFTISQTYNGGSDYPFSLAVSSGSGANAQTGSFGVTLNSQTNDVTGNFALNVPDSSGATTVNGSFKEIPSSNPLSVVAPGGAKPLSQVISALGLDSLTQANGF